MCVCKSCLTVCADVVCVHVCSCVLFDYVFVCVCVWGGGGGTVNFSLCVFQSRLNSYKNFGRSVEKKKASNC